MVVKRCQECDGGRPSSGAPSPARSLRQSRWTLFPVYQLPHLIQAEYTISPHVVTRVLITLVFYSHWCRLSP